MGRSLYSLRDVPGTALIMPVVYSFRDVSAGPETLVGAIDLPARTKYVIESTIQVGRANGYALRDAATLAETVKNRYIGLDNAGERVAILEGWAPCGLRVFVTMSVVDENGMPEIKGELLAWLDTSGEPYRGADPERDGAHLEFVPFAFA